MPVFFYRSFVIGFFLFLSASSHAESGDAWRLTAQGNDFEIYQRPSKDTSGLEAFRLTGYINATPTEVATGILDREHRMQWMRDVRELRTVRLPKPGSVIEYSAVKTPFIIKDRDFVTQTDVEVDSVNQKILVVTHSVTESEVPETSSVRAVLIEGRFLMEPGLKTGTTKFTADMDVDPMGSVPRWIVNHFQKNWPIVMFRSLQNFLKKKVAVLPPDFQPLFTPASEKAVEVKK